MLRSNQSLFLLAFNQTTMIDAEGRVLIHHFKYPLASEQRRDDNEQMARLNYIASRIHAIASEGSSLWWWTGLRKEMVIVPNLIGKGLPYVKTGCC